MYKSIRDRQFNKADQDGGESINVALALLSDILDENRYNIPFVQEFSFTSYDDLQNTNFVEVVRLDYTIGDVKYPVKQVNLAEWDRKSVVINLRTLPQIYWFDDFTQSVKVYPEPLESDLDRFIVYAHSALTAESLDQDVPAGMPRFMQSYIKYETAYRLCNEYNVPWTEQKEKKRQELYNRLINFKRADLAQEDRAVMHDNDAGGKGSFPFFWYISGGSIGGAL